MFLSFWMSACAAPILNAEDSPKSSEKVSTLQPQTEGDNLLKAYGCPQRFEDIALCAQIFWFDDQGKSVEGPIYWQKYREHAMSAKILFWSSKDGWPVDPRVEFSDAKIIKVKLFMPSMGHGTMGYFPSVEEIKGRVGQFSVKNIRFIMACDEEDPWDFRIQLKTAHHDDDFDASDEPSKEPNVWKQKILKFTSIEKR